MEENLILSLYEYTSFSELKKKGGGAWEFK